jgi:hypothetical protein
LIKSGRDFASVHLDALSGHRSLVAMTMLSQHPAFPERRNIQSPENFAKRGARNAKIIISQQFTLNSVRAKPSFTQF